MSKYDISMLHTARVSAALSNANGGKPLGSSPDHRFIKIEEVVERLKRHLGDARDGDLIRVFGGDLRTLIAWVDQNAPDDG